MLLQTNLGLLNWLGFCQHSTDRKTLNFSLDHESPVYNDGKGLGENLTQDRRALGASIRDIVNSTGDIGSTQSDPK